MAYQVSAFSQSLLNSDSGAILAPGRARRAFDCGIMEKALNVGEACSPTGFESSFEGPGKGK
jgi:hypothetical protein